MSEYDKIIDDMADVRKHLDAWLEVSKQVLEEGDEADLRLTLRLTLEWLVEMTELAMATFAEMLAVAIERDEGQVSDSVLDTATNRSDELTDSEAAADDATWD